jgi:O-antigen/teichoic acid export membrane protein
LQNSSWECWWLDPTYSVDLSIKKQTLWSMAPLLSVTVVNIVSTPLFYRCLGPEMYALWFYVLTFSGAFGFADLGLGVAVGRYIGVALGRGDQAAVREYWGTGNAIAVPLLSAMGLIFAVLGASFGPKWFHVSPMNISLLRWCFIAGGVALFVSFYAQFWLILSQAELDFKFISIVRVFISLFQVIPAMFWAYLTANPFVLIAWSTLVALLQLVVFIRHAQRHYGLGLSLSAARWARAREMAAYTGKTFATLLVNSLLGSADRLALGKLAPSADFAHYNIANNVGSRIQGLSVAVMGPVFHNTSRAIADSSRVSAAEIYNETFRFTFGWYVLAAVWATVWAQPALTLWLGPDLATKVEPIFAPMIIGYCITSIANISGSQLGPLNRVGTGIFFHVTAGLTLAACVIAGWKLGGMKGVAYGFLGSRAVFLMQDIFIIRLIGAGGWLSITTWLHIGIQVAVGTTFFVVSQALHARVIAVPVCAAAHAGVVGLLLLRDVKKPLSKAYQPN